jgi:hypothetical protein
MGDLTTDDSSRITPSRSSSMATGSSAGRDCVAFPASGESAESADSHGRGFVWADPSQDDSQTSEGEVR